MRDQGASRGPARELHGVALASARFAYFAVAAVTFLTFAAAIPVWVDEWTGGPVRVLEATARLRAAYAPVGLVVVLLTLLALAGTLGVAALIFWRRSRDRFGLLASLTLVTGGVSVTGALGSLRLAQPTSAPSVDLVGAIANSLILLVLLIFPDGRFAFGWTRWLWLAFAAWQASSVVTPEVGWTQLGGPGLAAELAFLASAIAAQVLRYRQRANLAQRQQTKWVVLGLAAALLAFAVRESAALLIPGLGEPTLATLVFLVASRAPFDISLVALSASIAIAVLRYGLFDVDLLVNRTIVYGAVTAVLAGAFAGVSGLAQRLVQALTGQESGAVPIVVAVAVAVAFSPVRRQVQTIVDRHLQERMLVTVLFSDIVASTDRLATIGDRRYRELRQAHLAAVRREIERYGGREVNTAGDGVFAVFLAPAVAIRCALSICEVVHALGLEVRTGVHTGECELRGDDVVGIGVHTGARVMAAAAPGEVMVSSTVRDLVAGSEIRFVDRGLHILKGVPGEWRLYAAEA